MIQIKKNDYVQPTECREEVVQAICEAFLDKSIFHSESDGRYRERTLYVCISNGKGCGFSMCYNDSNPNRVRIRGCEMKRAFKELIDAGYFMFKIWQYGSWAGYIADFKPETTRYKSYQRVSSFDDFID